MDLLVGHALALDVFINDAALFLIVAERVEYLREGEVGEPDNDLFGSDPELPQFGDGSYRRPRPGNDGSTVENLVGTDNIGMARSRRHVLSPSVINC